ncbi:N-acetyltransferase family protein [Salipaludibacillus sp. CF4.18]|uniref:GNAT family N-acetyltransferase n=1 Tax=Salipaludibacillus sp. CF4.18 TaxID=3373081 RepID=UPI003EE6177B
MIIRQAKVNDWKGIARVHVDCVHSSYKNILPPATLDKFTYNTREQRWKKDLPSSTTGGAMTYVVEDSNGTIVGFSLAGTMRDARLRIKYTGEIYGVYVHPDVQGKGYGKKLFECAVQHLSSVHFSTIALWTFKDLDSGTFFKHLDGEQVYEKSTTIGGEKLEEIAYGWDNLKPFSVLTEDLN